MFMFGGNIMKNYMKLKNDPFMMITIGVKTIEMRLYDDKHRKV